MAELLKAECEACGEKDWQAKQRMMATGRTDYGPQPHVRGLILCPACREAVKALIRDVRGLPADGGAAEVVTAVAPFTVQNGGEPVDSEAEAPINA